MSISSALLSLNTVLQVHNKTQIRANEENGNRVCMVIGHTRFAQKIKEVQDKIQKIREKKQEALKHDTLLPTWLEEFKQYEHIKTLERRVVVELIDHIEVHSKTEIEIHFCFEDELHSITEKFMEYHLRASRNYSKKNRPLPVLSVVEDGILRGYVPFDKDWTGFSAEEYREASESVMKEPDVTVTADVKKRLDLTGYEIVRVQYFSTMQNPAMTISNGRLRFNTACLKKFENVEYVELLLNSVERCIAIRPCDKNNPNAIRWGRLKEGRWCASTLGCRGLAKTLFDIMEWDEDLRYRFRGQFLEQGDNKMMLFAFDEPEMIKVEEIVLPPKENTEEDEGETVKKKIYIFPPEWAGTFGQPITSIAQVGILRQEHYAGNWDVFRPATEIEEMNIFTAESLNELLREAEKIMEGWTDYR